MTDSTKYTSRLRGRKVLIFGGSSGLGYAAAEACIENGMDVVIASSSDAKVQNAIDRIMKEYPSAKDRLSGHACNLGDQETLEENIVNLFDKVGKLDHISKSQNGRRMHAELTRSQSTPPATPSQALQYPLTLYLYIPR